MSSGRREATEGGYVLITALIAMAVMAVLATAALAQANTALRIARQATQSEQAFYVANAGMEEVLAQVRALKPPGPGDAWNHLMAIEAGLQGEYQVSIRAADAPGYIQVTSRGQVGQSVRQITGRLPVATRPPIYNQALLIEGSLLLQQQSTICGDVVSNSPIALEQHVGIGAPAKDNPHTPPCSYIAGTGKLVSPETVTFPKETGRSKPQVPYCDADHYGPGTPCPTAPQPTAMPVIDLERLRADATQVLEGDLDLTAWPLPPSRVGAILFVDGNVTIPKNSTLTMPAPATLVATGTITLEQQARLVCGKTACANALIAGGGVSINQNAELHAAVLTAGDLAVEQNVSIYGNLQAASATFRQGFELRPQPAPTVPPPGLPIPGGSGLPTSFDHWREVPQGNP